MSLHDVSARDLSLVNQTALDDPHCITNNLIFTHAQFDNLNYQLKRRLAAQTSIGEINGKSTSLAMRSYFCRQASLDEFSGND